MTAKYLNSRLPFSLKVVIENMLRNEDGRSISKAVVPLICRIDALDELEYFRNGEILQYVRRQLAA